VDRRAAAPIPAGRCLPHLVAAIMEDIVVGRRVEVPIPDGQCPVRLVAAVLEAAETAAGLPVVFHAEATPEADRVAGPLTEDTVIAK